MRLQKSDYSAIYSYSNPGGCRRPVLTHEHPRARRPCAGAAERYCAAGRCGELIRVSASVSNRPRSASVTSRRRLASGLAGSGWMANFRLHLPRGARGRTRCSVTVKVSAVKRPRHPTAPAAGTCHRGHAVFGAAAGDQRAHGRPRRSAAASAATSPDSMTPATSSPGNDRKRQAAQIVTGALQRPDG